MTQDGTPRSFDARREALYQRLLAERGLTDAIPAADRSRPLPASFAQERAWFLDQLEGELPVQNVTKAFWLRGALDVGALERALTHVVTRHEPLRTVFELLDGALVQRVQPPFPVTLDRRAIDREAVADVVVSEARRPMDLNRGPILRGTLLSVSDEVHALVVTVHHIAADGWSAGLLVGELCTAYAAFASGAVLDATPTTVQYADVAAWQRGPGGTTQIEQGLAYFRTRLADPPPPLDLPASRPAPSPRTGDGSEVSVGLADIEDALQAFAHGEQTTLFEVLLAGYAALLSRISGARDLIIGTPYANRPQHSLEALIGLFATTIPLRVTVDGATSFRDLVRHVRTVARAAATFQSVPFDRIVQEVRRGQRGAAPGPLFSVWFALQNWPMPRLALPGLTVEPIAVPAQATEFDLSLDLWRPAGGLGGRLEFTRDLFDEGAATSIVAWYRTLLADAISQPDRRVDALRLLDERARADVLALGRGPDASGVDVLERLACHARERPSSPAVIDDAGPLTFGDLARRSDQLADDLVKSGMGPERIAALRLSPDWKFAVAAVAVLKTGGAFLPIDPDTPEPRLRRILDDAQPAVTIRAGLGDAFELERASTGAPPPGCNHDERLAYIIYTSGSTGRPKGAATPHRCLAAYVAGAIRAFGLSATDRILQFAPLGFDVIVEELFPIWAAGGTVVFRGDSLPLEPREFVDLVERHAVTLVEIPNLYWHLLADDVERGLVLPQCLRLLLVGCGAMATERVRAWRKTGVDLVHVYGLSETTVTSTVCDVARWNLDAHRWSRLPIGHPTSESRIYLLDGNLQPVPRGVRGEIYIGGALVARGYLRAPAGTADRFVPDPFDAVPGARMYRTGDGGRYLADGTLDFLGRKDDQVKVRGFRIELGEIDAGCRAHPDVLDVATIAVPSDGGDHRLVAFVVARTAAKLDARALREHLRARLPAYMVPSDLVFLPRLPETPHGKVDRAALQALRRTSEPRPPLPPRTATELTIASTWQTLLAVEDVRADDDFFMLGGHSLLATRVTARLRAELGVTVPVKWLFETTILQDLAARIEASSGTDTRVPRRTSGPEAPLSFMQEHLWFLHQLDPGSAAYHLPTGVRLRGPLNVPALQTALTALVQRHEILRTVFVERDGIVRQRILDEADLQLEEIDLSTHDDPGPDLERQARRSVQAPFDLTSAPPVRAQLWRLAEHDHVLLLTLHHLLADAWSLGVVVEELTRGYLAALGPPADDAVAPTVQFADVAVWQRARMTPERVIHELAYWKQQLAGRPHGTTLRGDRPRPAVPSGLGETIGFEVPPSTAAQLRRLARECGATPASVLLAAFSHLLHRRTGDLDVVVGVPSTGRDHPDTHRLIGCLLNTVVVRIAVNPEPFVELVQRARAALAGALAHADVPFERVVEAMRPPRDLSLHPLFQIMFSFEQLAGPAEGDGTLAIERYGVHTGGAQFDLTLDITDDGGAMNGVFCFATDLFDAITIAALREDLLGVLEAVAIAPGTTLPASPAGKRRRADARGFDLDLDEIDDALRTLPGVLDAHTTVTDDTRVLTSVVQVSQILGEDEIRRQAEARLAGFMVPDQFLVTTHALRDAAGQVLTALPSRSSSTHAMSARRPDGDTVLHTLTALWRDVLGQEDIGPDDNFFSIGGDSLTCLTLVARARAQGLAFTPRDLFRNQTLRSLSAVVSNASVPSATPTARYAAARVSPNELEKLLDHVGRIRR